MLSTPPVPSHSRCWFVHHKKVSCSAPSLIWQRGRLGASSIAFFLHSIAFQLAYQLLLSTKSYPSIPNNASLEAYLYYFNSWTDSASDNLADTAECATSKPPHTSSPLFLPHPASTCGLPSAAQSSLTLPLPCWTTTERASYCSPQPFSVQLLQVPDLLSPALTSRGFRILRFPLWGTLTTGAAMVRYLCIRAAFNRVPKPYREVNVLWLQFDQQSVHKLYWTALYSNGIIHCAFNRASKQLVPTPQPSRSFLLFP